MYYNYLDVNSRLCDVNPYGRLSIRHILAIIIIPESLYYKHYFPWKDVRIC